MSVSRVGKPLGVPSSYIILSMPTLGRNLSRTLVPLAFLHFLPPFRGNYWPPFLESHSALTQLLMWYRWGSVPHCKVELVA